MNWLAEHDVRLVPSAVLVWLIGCLGVLAYGGVLRWVAAGALVVMLVAAGMWWRTPTARALALALAGAAAASMLAALLALIRLDARATSPVANAAQADGFVRIVGEVRERPRAVNGSRGLVVVSVEVATVDYRSVTTSTRVAVAVLGRSKDWSDVLPGARVRFSGTAHLPDRTSTVVALITGASAPRHERGPPRWSSLAHHVRSGLRAAATVNDGDTAGLLVAMVDGDTTGIGPITLDEFRRSGLAHLLAVSGANVAIVVGAALWLARLLRVPFWGQIACGAASLLMFVAVTGTEPSVLRAAAMGVVMLIALASGRPRTAIPALCTAVLVLVSTMPELAMSVGFVLSVLATAGIVVLAAPWTDRWSRVMPRWLAAAFAVAAAAAVVTLPVIVLLLPVVNVASVVANVLAAPAVPIVTICGVLAAVLAPIAMPIAQFFCFTAGFGIRWIASVSRVAADRGPWQFSLPAGVAAFATVIGVLVVGVTLVRLTRARPTARVTLAGAAVGVLVLSIPVRCAFVPRAPSDWLIAACDVGQGDAVLARGSDGGVVLFDAGPDPALLENCLAELEVERVDLVVLTHFHDDHVAGVPAVLGRRDVGAVVFGTFDGGAAERSVRQLAGASATRVIEVSRGWTTSVSGVDLEVIAPVREILGSTSDPNNNSLIVRVTVDGVRMLVTGDAQVEQDATLVGCGCLQVDVLKVAHHGSKNRDDDFIAQTGASLALISVGADNAYGHPAPSTVSELERLGITIRRTDRDGTITVARDGDSLVTYSSGPAAGAR